MTDQQPTSGDTDPRTGRTLAGAPATAESLPALTRTDPTAMTGAALVDAIVASEKALSLLAGTQMRLLAALAVPFVAGDPMRLAAVLARKNCITNDDDPDQVAHFVPLAAASLASEEVAAALRIPCHTAGNRVAEADRMTGVLAPTLNALEQGSLDRVKARVIADHCPTPHPRTNPGPAGPGAARRRGVDHHRTAGRRRAGGDHRRPRRRRGPAPGSRRPPRTPDAARAGRDGHVEGAPARRRCGEDLPGQRPARHRHRRHPRRHAEVSAPAGSTPSSTSPITSSPTGSSTSPTTSANNSPTTAPPPPAPAAPAPAPAPAPSASTETAATAATGSADVSSAEPAAAPTTADTDTDDNADIERQDHRPTPTPVTSTDRRHRRHGRRGNHRDGPVRAEHRHRRSCRHHTDDPANTDTDGPEAASTPEATAPESLNDARADADAAVSSGAGAAAAATGAAAKGPSTKRGGNRVFTRQGRRPHLSVTIGLSTLAGLDNLPGVPRRVRRHPRRTGPQHRRVRRHHQRPDHRPRHRHRSPPPAPSPTDPPRNSATRSPPSSTCASSRPAGNPSGVATWTTGKSSTTSIPNRAAKTDETNVGPMCRRHHLIKHHSDWRIRIDPNRYCSRIHQPHRTHLPETKQAGRRTRTMGQHRRHRHRRTPRQHRQPTHHPRPAPPTTNPPRPATSKTYSPPS